MVLLVKKNIWLSRKRRIRKRRVHVETKSNRQIDKKSIVYVDEAGIDNREDYPYGYGVKGKRLPGMESGKRTERVSWIAAINQEQMLAPLTFVGSCNRDLFENWLEHC